LAIGAELGDLRLDLDHRQRRAQFVRRVGSEAALALQRVAQPEEQPVEGGQSGCASLGARDWPAAQVFRRP
jgi:hypothetical protein